MKRWGRAEETDRLVEGRQGGQTRGGSAGEGSAGAGGTGLAMARRRRKLLKMKNACEKKRHKIVMIIVSARDVD